MPDLNLNQQERLALLGEVQRRDIMYGLEERGLIEWRIWEGCWGLTDAGRQAAAMLGRTADA